MSNERVACIDLATMCPEWRPEVVALGLKSIVAGTLATCLTAAAVGLVL